MKILGPKNIVFTIWYDNVFGCTNKCKFCNLSTPMIHHTLQDDNSELFTFLKVHYDEIRLLKLMGQEPYRELEMISTIEQLLDLGFKRSQINLTTIGSTVYHQLLKEIGYVTLSFSGYNPSYYGFPSKEHPYKKNIITLFNQYGSKVDKINWIIGKFNLANIDNDLQMFFDSIQTTDVKITFLIQKGVVYSKQDVLLFTKKLENMMKIFSQRNIRVFEKEYNFYDNEYNVTYNSRENTELTYAYNREKSHKWYRCTWELVGKHALEAPEQYIKGEYANNCTKICAGGGFCPHPNIKEIFFYKLMLKKLSYFESSLV